MGGPGRSNCKRVNVKVSNEVRPCPFTPGPCRHGLLLSSTFIASRLFYRQTDRQTDRQRHRDTGRDTQRHRERQR